MITIESSAPLLEESLRSDAESALLEIAADLPKLSETDGSDGLRIPGCTLSSGRAGVAVFFHYMDRVYPESGYGAAAEGLIDAAVEEMAAAPLSPGLYGGFSGVAWAALHIASQRPDLGYDFSAVDDALLGLLEATRWTGHFDLISGLAGIGVYALEGDASPQRSELLARVIGHLRTLAERSEDGVSWHTPPEHLPPHQRARYPAGWYNLGMAHGIPAVLALLSMVSSRGMDADATSRTVEESARWLRGRRLGDTSRSFFPNAIAAEHPSPEPSRAAWCYGDPGVAVALHAAGAASGQTRRCDEARAILRSVARRTVRECGVVDASLCHGAGGLAHVFNRMYRATGDEALGDAAREWFARTLAMRTPGRGVGGFEYRSVSAGTFHMVPEPGLLEGAAGVGLALLGAVSAIPPSWDRILLTCPPAEYGPNSTPSDGPARG